ncbi:MAG: sigma-54-dependent Fis family transcriptional regulator [Deltaproteobacteria bacterium]|nr:sigma-54-dependent Fis family transcriptional regulator [Deltaproteobacteria bacterium]
MPVDRRAVEGEKNAPVVIVVARAPRLRRGVTAALTPEFAVHELQPNKALDPARWLDAAGMVVVLDAEDDETTLEALESLSAVPAAAALVLLLEADAPEDLIDSALEQLAPHQVLNAPVAAPVLRYAVRRALPSHTPGQGARPNHRPAQALLGVSSAIREVIDQIRQIAPTHIPALILGETGTGKELVARAIHEQSPRCGGLFVAINCGALPDSLLESELFGHRKGSFTGADRDKRGLFEHADGGTILLDEVGDTSPALQMKLLRVLENKEIRPLGDTQTIRVDVRVVSATHRNLEAAIEEGSFREDLYYRLNALTIYVPPLRRRRVDIPFLAQHFAEELGAAHARRITLQEDFLESLTRRDFPGNVRELRNAVERAIALATPGEPVTSEHLEPPPRESIITPLDLGDTLKELVDRVETEAIRTTLERFGGNRRRAAEALGLSRPGLRYKLRRLGLEPSP